MAEVVQRRIEEMLPELEQMQRIELFTANEVRAILKRRKALEYKLRRKTKQKEDILQYIQYELNVLALVKKRRQKTGIQFKKSEIDLAIINRIHKLFEMACLRFSSDVNVWLSYIDFYKRREEKGPVGNLYIKMLQIHNKKPELWVLAAKWEMEQHLSMENARDLLQRGLRFNPKSEHLWQEYFRMELLNADKLRKRRDVLGLAALSKEETDVSDTVLEGKVAIVVFKKAVEAIPDKVEFCLSFVPICKLFDFAKSVEEEIFTYLQTNYPTSELLWEATALRALKTDSELGRFTSRKEREKMQFENELEVIRIFDNAVKQINTEKMWSLYIKFCHSNLLKKASRKLADKRVELLLRVFQQASEEDKLSAEMYTTWVDVLCRVGQTDAVSGVLCHGLARHPRCLALWLARLRFTTATNPNHDDVRALIDDALNSVNEKESYPLWEVALSWSRLHDPEYGERLLKDGITKCAEISVPLKIHYLQWRLFDNDKDDIREIYGRLSATQPLSLEFFKTYIQIEMLQAKPSIKRIRQAYEDAIQHYGSTNVELWIDYIKLEMNHPKGTPQKTGQIHWRALKTLNGELTENFVTQYTLLQTGNLQ